MTSHYCGKLLKTLEFFAFRRVTRANGKFWQIVVANLAPTALSLAAVPHPPELTQHSTMRTMPPRAQADKIFTAIRAYGYGLVSIRTYEYGLAVCHLYLLPLY